MQLEVSANEVFVRTCLLQACNIPHATCHILLFVSPRVGLQLEVSAHEVRARVFASSMQRTTCHMQHPTCATEHIISTTGSSFSVSAKCMNLCEELFKLQPNQSIHWFSQDSSGFQGGTLRSINAWVSSASSSHQLQSASIQPEQRDRLSTSALSGNRGASLFLENVDSLSHVQPLLGLSLLDREIYLGTARLSTSAPSGNRSASLCLETWTAGVTFSTLRGFFSFFLLLGCPCWTQEI